MGQNPLIYSVFVVIRCFIRLSKPSLMWVLLAILSGCMNLAALRSSGGSDRVVPLASAQETLNTMEQAADWQLPRLESLTYINKQREESLQPRGWVQATFTLGLTELAERSKNPEYAAWIGRKGKEGRWQLGAVPSLADDQLIAQTYLWYFFHQDPDLYYLDPTRRAFNRVLKNHSDSSLVFTQATNAEGIHQCQTRWCWADALFMAPASWFGMSLATGETAYADFAHKEVRATVDFLMDPKQGLLRQDSRFNNAQDTYGNPLFWSRSGGWVLAGLARMMESIPNADPRRDDYEQLFIDMAATLKNLQKRDGTWSTSLLAKESMKARETSGTALLTYAMAWGVNHGLLDDAEYIPVVAKAWASLNRAIDSKGKLGWVHQLGAGQTDVKAKGSQVYAVGALLLAGAEIYDYQRQKTQ